MSFYNLNFIFIFLPVILIIYFLLTKYNCILASKVWLIVASLVFYGSWNIAYLPLLIFSIVFNYLIGYLLVTKKHIINLKSPHILAFGIIINLLLLGYFKYANFFISNINYLSPVKLTFLNIALPLGISFFTFTQITYLIDAYKKEAEEYSFINYLLFVTFFPHLLIGPILHHKEMMPQFEDLLNKNINFKNLYTGLFIFAIGLFKKIVFADTFAVYVNAGYSANHINQLTFFDSWYTTLAYTLQIYFDFSGYCDMAYGIALMFNIELPINFFAPHKSTTITEFWKRWHITFGRLMKNYVYIPLGGSRKGTFITYRNLFIVFLVGGLWHGASWLYILWGFTHGLALVIHRIWKTFNLKMNNILSWLITFLFINFSGIIFRAQNFENLIIINKKMLGLSLDNNNIPSHLLRILNYDSSVLDPLYYLSGIFILTLFMAVAFIIILCLDDPIEMKDKLKPGFISVSIISLLISSSVLYKLFFWVKNPFVYYYF